MPKHTGSRPVTEVERLRADLDIFLRRTKGVSLMRDPSPLDHDQLGPGVLATLQVLEEIYNPPRIKSESLLKEY
ncbi:hypothetical protein F4695_003950 [Rhizobium soli]|uniref:Uncharacterized protein n=1 Tax=Rhizobium soli TaxID=424798 RepID=A0A7X0MTB5_9HYPH|nr:hypothetical protein [Rhizobium soli]